MADNASFYAALDKLLDDLRADETLCEDAAPEVAKELHAQIAKNVAAQVDPYGHPWPESKAGGPVLVNAAKAVSATTSGSTIILELTGPEVRHHVGSAKGYHGGSAKLGGYRRPIIPWKSLPGPMKAVVRRVLKRRFDAIHGGR